MNPDINSPAASPASPLERRTTGGRQRALILLTIVVMGALCGLRTWQLRTDPQVSFLSTRRGAEWIRPNLPFNLVAYFAENTRTYFRCRFLTTSSLSDPRLSFAAFRRCEMLLDGKSIYSSPANTASWREFQTLQIPGLLPPGEHLLEVVADNRLAHPCIWVQSSELGISTASGWEFSWNRREWSRALSVLETPVPEIVLEYPDAQTAFLSRLPWLATVFFLVFLGAMVNRHERDGIVRWRICHVTSGRIRWMLLASWVLLAINNITTVPEYIGFDVHDHLEYVKSIVDNRRLPLATEGWQRFQSPLFYLIAAPVYALLTPQYPPEFVIKALRILPLLCGLAQIEIVYRSALAVFPDRDDLQGMATLAGGLMPMHVYISQVIGNEPLAGCLTALLILQCLWLLTQPSRVRSLGFFAAMGGVWGAALLAKVTPFLLTPVLLVVLIAHCRACGVSLRQGLARVAAVYGVCLLVSGWYYLRNWILLGKPFIGGWDPAIGIVWWQDPSYRTWEQLTTFGRSLNRPIFSGAWSLWDSLYSTMWFDGATGGGFCSPKYLPWNVNWMIAGAWLALIPSALMLAGTLTVKCHSEIRRRNAVFLALGVIAVYLAAFIDLYVRLPVYSTGKASYMLGLVPCFALLMAEGAARIMRSRVMTSTLTAAIASWGVAVYCAYFAHSTP